MSEDGKSPFGEFIDDIKEVAIEAEYETGEREGSFEEAKASIIVRMAKIVGGFALVIVGIILLPLPGPGWVVIAAGLGLLATEFEWAENLLQEVRKRMPGVPEDGKIPAKTLVIYGAIMIGAMIIAALWGTEIKDWLKGFF